MDANGKLLQRIRKLMALGSRNDNAHEAARALRLAQKLMQRHNLSETDVNLSAIRETECRQVYCDAVNIPGWLNALAAVVCMATGCRCWFNGYQAITREGNHRYRRSVHFYGLHERPEVASYVFTVLSRQLKTAAQEHMKTAYRLSRLKLQTKRNRADQFREGWVSGVWVVLGSFAPSDKEVEVLKHWLSQRCGNNELADVNVRDAGRCRGDSNARLSSWLAGQHAKLSHGLNDAQSTTLALTGGGDDE
jgi:hypothetical protein